MLVDPVDIAVEDPSLGFEEAKEIADRKAREISEDSMLIAWSGSTGRAEGSPLR
jgi:hypothetical protein